MKQYQEALEYILKNGEKRMDRTGEGTLSVFGLQMEFDLSKGFPAITTKKLAWKSMLSELIWFIEGSGDERRLAEILYGDRDASRSTIWSGNAQAPYWEPKANFKGDLGRVYGVQWRQWRTPLDNSTIFKRIKNLFKKEQYIVTDQLTNLIEGIKKDPYGRRHILSAWNPGELSQMALPPCHTFCQFYVSNGKLSCKMYQRSADFFLGVPFNIASYALFLHLIAQVCDLEVGTFIHTFGDAHIYLNHIDAVKEQLLREPFPLPMVKINSHIKNIEQFTMNDITLENYQHHASIKAPMAV